MSENFGWNYFENEVVIGDRQDKKRMIVLVFSNFMDIPYNRKSFDELVDKLNELSEEKEYFERKKEYFLSKWSIVNVKNIQLRQEIDDLKEENEKLRQELNEIKENPINYF